LPPKLRLSIDDDQLPAGIAPRAEIDVRARLVPPPPMALPRTYDFARDAWFQRLGGRESRLTMCRSFDRARRSAAIAPAVGFGSISRDGSRQIPPASLSLWPRAIRISSTRTMPTRCGAEA
jgi:hypothetical protein